MKKEEANIYREIQKNAQMALNAIDIISDKIYDEALARQIAREALKYSDIRNRAVDKLLQGRAGVYKAGPFSKLMLKGTIHINTVLNTSTGHIAELLIRGSNRGIVTICKALNHNPGTNGYALEMAKEFMAFEEKNIERLKKYL